MKNKDLREIYKEYLKPIVSEISVAFSCIVFAAIKMSCCFSIGSRAAIFPDTRPIEASPPPPSPPSKLKQTCFSAKVKFARGPDLFRKLEQRLGKVCKWDVYKVPTVPVRCPCETVCQHIDPNRKKAGRKTGTYLKTH